MPMFMCLLNWTDQGIRAVKEAPKRAKAAQELAKKVGVEIKEVYLTSGDSDLLVLLETPNGDNVAKFALAIGSKPSAERRSRTSGSATILAISRCKRSMRSRGVPRGTSTPRMISDS